MFEIVIVSKTALAIVGLTILGSADDASKLVVFDGILAVLAVDGTGKERDNSRRRREWVSRGRRSTPLCPA